MEPVIETKGLKHVYIDSDNNPVTALDGIDLQIMPGEFVAVIGANGSGKSTLARHFNALLLPSEGSVNVHGMDTLDENNLWQIRQDTGMVFQNPDNQIVAAVVEEDVAFGPENIGVPTEELKQRVEDA
ncbi:MAG: ATP-binding cassette domain-containing protein, partial [Acidaminococcaceae bacterium]|nr:ATP-binding cassette domain-containing protein [Acidaminococcaceae bacterium]